jgi:hypothetical protein
MAVVSFDVWLISTNTIYRSVPFGAITDWAQQGRLSPDDKVKDAGPGENWVRVADHSIVSDYLFLNSNEEPAIPGKAHEELEPIEMDVGWKKRSDEGDDDPDLIPLIDISLVLLIFFMMTATVSNSSPFPNPEMANAANISEDPEAFVVEINKNLNGDPMYSFKIGNSQPEVGAADLPTLAEVMRLFDAKLAEILPRATRAPSMQFACHKELSSDRILELTAELEKRKKEGKIIGYGAIVNERSK